MKKKPRMPKGYRISRCSEGDILLWENGKHIASLWVDTGTLHIAPSRDAGGFTWGYIPTECALRMLYEYNAL